MQFLNKWERKFGWLSFPGVLRYYAIFHLMVFLLQYLHPQIASSLDFDRTKILTGEAWRLVTFLFASSGTMQLYAPQTLFLFIMVMLSFMMSNALETAWGVFRTSMFFYTGYIGLLIANFLYDLPLLGSGYFIYASAFFAFATLFPRVEFLMMFIIPVQARWLAILAASYYVIAVFRMPMIIGFFLLGFVNYLLWAGIPALRGQARVIEATQRRKRFQKNASSDEDAFHRCAECDRTDLSDPELEFRMSVDGKEYCTDHLKD